MQRMLVEIIDNILLPFSRVRMATGCYKTMLYNYQHTAHIPQK